MAYLPQDILNNPNQPSSQVLGPNQQPQQVGQQMPVGGSQQSATIEGSQGAPSQNTPSVPNAPKKASSGQFTNLKSYIGANQGAGQKIGQSLTGGMEKSAQQVGAAIQQQKQQFSSQISQQEAQRAAAGTQAQNIFNQANAPQQTNQSASMSPEDITTFRDLASGNKSFNNVQDLNLTPQQIQQEQLARKANELKSFEGRTGQLKETFGKQRQYGTGSSSLDSMLLQTGGLGDVLSKAKQTSTGLEQNIKGAQAFGSGERSRLIAENQAFAQGLQGQAEGGKTGVIQDIDKLVAQQAAERQDIINQQINPLTASKTAEIDDLLKYYSGENTRQRTIDQMRSSLGGGMFNSAIKNQLEQATIDTIRNTSASDPGYQAFLKANAFSQGPQQLPAYINKLIQEQRGVSSSPAATQAALQNYIKTGQGLSSIGIEDNYGYMQPAVREAFGFTGGQDKGTLGNIGFGGMENAANPYTDRLFDQNRFNLGALETERARVENALNAQKTNMQTQLQNAILGSSGVSYADFLGGKDIKRESVASDVDRARYGALSKLAGTNPDELMYQRPQSATKVGTSNIQETLRNISKKYGRPGASL